MTSKTFGLLFEFIVQQTVSDYLLLDLTHCLPVIVNNIHYPSWAKISDDL